MKTRTLKVVGWREWISLPELGVERIKAKLDTGALYSTLHATRIHEYTHESGETRVRFRVHSRQQSRDDTVDAEAPLVGWKRIRSSNGMTELRPVVSTIIELGGATAGRSNSASQNGRA